MYFNCIRASLESLRKIKRIFVIVLLHEVHIISARPELAMLYSATITAMSALPNDRCGINLAVVCTILSIYDANRISYGHDHNNLYFEVFGDVNL